VLRHDGLRSASLSGVPSRSSRLAIVVVIGVVLAACGESATETTPELPGSSTTSVLSTATSTTTAAAETTTTGSDAQPTTTGAPTTTAPATPELDQVSFTLTEVADLDEPIAMTYRPQDPSTLYVAERPGRIRLIRDGSLVDDVALDVTDLTDAGGEQVLLGIAIDPAGQRLYANYTDLSGDTQVVEFTLDSGGNIDPDSRREVLSIQQPYSNHNGGGLLFGPDGMLWIGTGDGGSGGDPERYATDPSSLLGKMLRIDPTPSAVGPYSVPPDNPFVDDASYRPEIWSTGLRNPWRYSFDRATGHLWVADVGQNAYEEITVASADSDAGRGAFYGWSALEGTERFNGDVSVDGALPPVHTYPHGDAGCSITGGFVYRGEAIPALQGAYVFADYCTPGVRAWDGTRDVRLTDAVSNVASFGEDAAGELWVLSLDGPVLRIDPA
jgi:glucose/arabinose dehydrogenase